MLKNWFLIACAGAGFTPFVAAQDPCSVAVDAHRAGDFERAITLYSECLKSNPGRFDLRSNLGAVLVREGRFADSIEQYKQALRDAPPPAIVPLHQNLGLAYYKSLQYAAAAQEFEAAIRQGPGDPNLTLLLADCYLQLGQTAKTLALLSPLEAARREDTAFDYVLGMALIREGQLQRGQQVVERILSNRDSPEAHFLLGSSMFHAQDFPAAVREFTAAAVLNPGLPGLQSYLGQALLQTGDRDGAHAAFARELQANPADFMANLQTGEILVQQNEPVLARRFLLKGLEIQPDSPEARLALAELDLADGRLEPARNALEQLAKAAPESSRIHRNLAELYARTGQTQAAQQERTLMQKIAPAAADGPQIGTMAPDFELNKLGTGLSVRLSDYGNKAPVLLVFASYTCPQFREQVEFINRLHDKFGTAVPMLLIYIREAHAGREWQSTINQRESVELPVAATLAQKAGNAQICVNRLRIGFPAVVDGMDGKVETLYAAWPSRIYLIDRAGRVGFTSRLGQWEFRAEDLTRSIQNSLSARGYLPPKNPSTASKY